MKQAVSGLIPIHDRECSLQQTVIKFDVCFMQSFSCFILSSWGCKLLLPLIFSMDISVYTFSLMLIKPAHQHQSLQLPRCRCCSTQQIWRVGQQAQTKLLLHLARVPNLGRGERTPNEKSFMLFSCTHLLRMRMFFVCVCHALICPRWESVSLVSLYLPH